MFGPRREINRRFERVAASIATPKMSNTSLLHILGPGRSKQRVTALRTLIENSFGRRRFRFTNLHDDTSLISYLRTGYLASLCDSKTTIIERRASCDRRCEQLVVRHATPFGYLSQVRNESAGKRQIFWEQKRSTSHMRETVAVQMNLIEF